MTAPIPGQVPYLDRLAVKVRTTPPHRLSCTELAHAFRHAHQLEDRGVSRPTLLTVSRVYARRLDELGPAEFDRRTLLGL